jgi:hypothetical protein
MIEDDGSIGYGYLVKMRSKKMRDVIMDFVYVLGKIGLRF